jgi:hypothetical protein
LNYNIRERYPIKPRCKRKWMVGRTTPSFNEFKDIPFSDINFEAKIHMACSSYSKLIPGKHIHTWENELFPMIDDKCTIFRGWKTILCNDQNDWTLQTDTRFSFSISISLVEHLFQIDFRNSCAVGFYWTNFEVKYTKNCHQRSEWSPDNIFCWTSLVFDELVE